MARSASGSRAVPPTSARRSNKPVTRLRSSGVMVRLLSNSGLVASNLTSSHIGGAPTPTNCTFPILSRIDLDPNQDLQEASIIVSPACHRPVRHKFAARRLARPRYRAKRQSRGQRSGQKAADEASLARAGLIPPVLHLAFTQQLARPVTASNA